MKNKLFISLFISILISLIFYISIDNLIISIVLFLIYFISLICLLRKIVQPSIEKNKKFHECYQFINSLVISLSVTHSISASYEKSSIPFEGLLKEQNDSIMHLLPKEKILYLKKYFNFDAYQMFINIIDIYEEQGGDILKMSHSLNNELTRIENSINLIEKRNIKKLFDFCSLWLTTFVILLFCRFALSQFYDMVIASPIYITSIVAFFIFVLLSIFLFSKQLSNSVFLGEKK
jgi:hypothetical protein